MSSRHVEIYSITNIDPMIIAQKQELCKKERPIRCKFALKNSANSEENLVASQDPLAKLEELFGKGNVSLHIDIEEHEILYMGKNPGPL